MASLREKVNPLAMREWSLTDFNPIRGAFGGRTDPRCGTNLEVYGLFMYECKLTNNLHS